MATINKQQLINELGLKCDELMARLNRVEDHCKECEQKKGPEFYKIQKDLRTLLIMREILSQVDGESVELKGDLATWYRDGIFATQMMRGSLDALPDVKVGASILELMEKHQADKNFMIKLQKYCAKKEWKLNFNTGKIEC